MLFSFADGAAIQTGQLSPGSLTFDNYVRVLTQPSGLRPFVISVVYSALAAVIAVGGLLFVARILQKHKNWVTASFEYLLHIPWILPSALLALGLIISYDHPNPLVGGAVLTGTTVILLIAFVTVKIPFTLRMLKASFASVNSSLEEAATIMGARTLYVFRRILLPLVLPAAAAIAALNFNSMLDDYDTAIFLAHPLVQPLGLVIKANTDGAEGVDGVSNTFVYTVLLMVITGLTMYLVYGRSGGRSGKRRGSKDGKRGGPGATAGTAAPAASPVVQMADAKASAPSPVP
ncbi:sulfate ABC transporter, permease protein CysT [compost metagenome]